MPIQLVESKEPLKPMVNTLPFLLMKEFDPFYPSLRKKPIKHLEESNSLKLKVSRVPKKFDPLKPTVSMDCIKAIEEREHLKVMVKRVPNKVTKEFDSLKPTILEEFFKSLVRGEG